jgi:NADPH:quinone reductase-like Zn-dependent oxidoreductase
MKAIVATAYGSPDVLQLCEVAKPAPKANEVLVRIHATTVTAAHSMMRKGVPLYGRLFIGLTRPKVAIPGTELAGEVEAVGEDVQHFKAGDQVFGATDLGGGCYAEYIALPASEPLLPKPANLSDAEAASLLDGATTALHFLRDQGEIRPGQQVLINGASGSVGSAAVQLARHFGAEVTGVCSSANVDLVRSLGAHHVIDYTQEDFTQSGQRYDIIFDAVGKSSFARCKRVLSEHGRYLSTVLGLPILLQMLWTSKVGSQKAKFAASGLRPASEKIEDIRFLKTLMESGELKAVIDRCYPLEEVADAHRYVDTGRKKGNVVILVARNSDSEAVQQT